MSERYKAYVGGVESLNLHSGRGKGKDTRMCMPGRQQGFFGREWRSYRSADVYLSIEI